MSLHLTGIGTLAVACDHCPARLLRMLQSEDVGDVSSLDVIAAVEHAANDGWEIGAGLYGRLEHRCPRCAS